MNITINCNGTTYGPYTLEEIKEYLANGNVSGNDWAWIEGGTDWVPISSIVENVPQLPSLPPLLPIKPATVDNPLTSISDASRTPSSEAFWAAFVLCLSLGIFGAHRFYLGKKSAWLMLITLGGLGVWYLIDLVLLLQNQFKDKNNIPVINPKPFLSWSVALIFLLVMFGNGSKNETTASLTRDTQKVRNLSPEGDEERRFQEFKAYAIQQGFQDSTAVDDEILRESFEKEDRGGAKEVHELTQEVQNEENAKP